MLSPARKAENDAVWVVESVLSSVKVVRRDRGGHQIHDFDIVREGEEPIPLEVTLATIPQLLEAETAHQHHGSVRALPGLRREWNVFSSIRSRFSSWDNSRLAALLLELEGKGVEKFFISTNASRYLKATRIAMELGIDAAFAHHGKAGRVLISSPHDDREWVGDRARPGRYALAALEEAAAQPDNQRKLATSNAGGHLFVWVDERNYRPWSDLDRGQVPRTNPQLGNSISAGWLATSGSRGDVICWVFERENAEWRQHGLKKDT